MFRDTIKLLSLLTNPFLKTLKNRMWLFIVAILLSLIFLAIIFIELDRASIKKRFKHIPVIGDTPIIGSKYLLQLFKFQDLDKNIHKLQPAPVAVGFAFHKPIFIISDPDVLQQIFKGNNFSEHTYITDLCQTNDSIGTARFKEWKPLRKTLRASFNDKLTASFFPTFQKYFLQCCDELQKHVNGGGFDINEYSSKTYTNCMLETYLGVEGNSVNLDNQLIPEYFNNVTERITNIFLHLDFIYKFSDNHAKFKAIYDRFWQSHNDILKNSFSTKEKEDKNFDRKRMLFIDTLLHNFKDLKDGKIVLENILSVLVAGLDSTPFTISTAALMLAIYPEIDTKVYKELSKNYKDGDVIDQNLLLRLPYLDCFIKEVLRLYTPAPLAIRTNMEDVNLNKVGFVKRGTYVVINYYSLHRWKHIWGEDADQFNPDRFLPENSLNRHPYAYLPFSSGPRSCLGQNFAINSMKIGLILLLSRYRFSTDLKNEDLEFEWKITMKLKSKHLVRVHLR